MPCDRQITTALSTSDTQIANSLTRSSRSYRSTHWLKQASIHHLSVAWGYCEVLPDQVTILAETAEKADEIDEQRALAAKERAEKRLMDVHNPDIDFARASASLQRALTRIGLCQRRER